VIATTGGFCLEAAAEKAVFTSAEIILKDRELAKEADRRKNELDERGFNFTWTVNIPAADGSPLQINVPVVRQADSDSVISLWFETTYGEFSIELLDPTGQRVELSRELPEQPLKLVPGRYVVVVQAINGAHVHGVIGINGPIGRCAIEGRRLTEHAADPAHGYWWPFFLVKPAPLASDGPRPLRTGTLLVTPNNIGGNTSEDIEFLRAWATCSLIDNSDINALKLAGALGTPVLVPLFPRPILPAKSPNSPWSDLELQALTRASLKEKSEPKFERIDLQLIAMIKAARKQPAAKDQPVQRRVLMAGFSAAGSFTNRFTVLHPEWVLAAAVGSPGGWPIAPVAVDQGETLRYPVGTADVRKLTKHSVNLKALRRVHFLFFLGDADTNDAVEYHNGVAKYHDSYSDADAELINRLFGETPVARWCRAQRLYDRARIHTQFNFYRGVRHEVTTAMRDDILDTFRKALGHHGGQTSRPEGRRSNNLATPRSYTCSGP